MKPDQYGSFVWKQIDGTRNLIEIREMVREQFGSQAKPLFERLAQYFETLKGNRFVIMKKEQ